MKRPGLIVLAAFALAACVRHAPPAPVMEGQSARPAPVAVASAAPAVVPDTPPQLALAPSPGIAREPVEVTPLEPPPPTPPQPRAAAPSIGAGSSIPHPAVPHPDRVVVQTGDTLYAIARRVNVPVRALIDANGLTAPYSVAAGRSLTVPQLRQHVVQPGETLYAVARLFGVDVATLARANDLVPPYAVRVGEVLALPEAAPVPATEPKPRPPAEIEPAAGPQPSPPQQSQQEAVATPPPVPLRGGRSFLWPVRGRLIAGYGPGDGGTHNDGINIAAPAGTVVLAADAGTVAYAGNELRGYGNLVLIKHAGGWMTAYAHNSKLLVKRGDKVKRGQPIARVGKSGTVAEPQLHFEIRRGSKALDPADYLPATPATVSG